LSEHYEILSFSDQGLRVPTITLGPRIDSREKLTWIIEILKVYLAYTQCDEQNPEIVSKTEEIKFSAKIVKKMKFHENRGDFELKLSIRVEISSIRVVKICNLNLKT
jgi:hypothetical protein